MMASDAFTMTPFAVPVCTEVPLARTFASAALNVS